MLREIEKVRTYMLFDQQNNLQQKMGKQDVKVVHQDEEKKKTMFIHKGTILDIIV